jgi:hypothetical protein
MAKHKNTAKATKGNAEKANLPEPIQRAEVITEPLPLLASTAEPLESASKPPIAKTLKKQMPKHAPPALPKVFLAYTIFECCIYRARNLVRLHEAAHGRAAKPEKYLADAHRAAIVLAISALDAYVRSHVMIKIRTLLADKKAQLSESLSARIKQFLKEDGLLDAARKDDLLDRVEKAFKKDFEKKSFQGTEAITDGLKLVGIEDVFHQVALKAGRNEDTLKTDLDRFSKRRHSIAHRGDYDLDEIPPRENPITKKEAEDCIGLVLLIASTIEKL